MTIDQLDETPVPDAEDEPNTESAIEDPAAAAVGLDDDEDDDAPAVATDGSADTN